MLWPAMNNWNDHNGDMKIFNGYLNRHFHLSIFHFQLIENIVLWLHRFW